MSFRCAFSNALALDKWEPLTILDSMKISPASLLLLFIPLMLANCRSSKTGGGGGGSDTPSHSMSRSEYPFDEDGNYREDWVRGGGSSSSSSSSGREVVDLTVDNPPSPFLGTTDPRDTYTYNPPKKSSSSTRSSSSSSRSSTKSSSSRTASSKSKPKPKKPVPKSSVVTVKKGDTLYGLALRHKTSVKAIQAANGLGSSTNLREGRALKIPK
jgi:LysM repeat protein